MAPNRMAINALTPAEEARKAELEDIIEKGMPSTLEFLHSLAMLKAHGIDVEGKVGSEMLAKAREIREWMQIDFTN